MLDSLERVLTLLHYVASVCRQPKLTKMSTNVEIVEFLDYIWNWLRKCIQKVLDMPSIIIEIS